MAKIESYPQASPVTTADLLIGTDVNDSNATKNFSVASILALQDNLTVKDEGVNVTTDCTSIDIVGSHIAATAVGGAVTITESVPDLIVKEEGGNVTTDCTSIDVVGAGATASAVGSAVTLTIPGTLTVATDAGGDRELVIGDAHTYIRFTGIASSITVPANTDVAFSIGTEIVLRPANAQPNLRTIAAAGVTINFYSPAAGVTAKVNLQDNLFLKKVGTDEWDAWGNLI